jgi:DNA-binding beta-propeller fold protein YncE
MSGREGCYRGFAETELKEIMATELRARGPASWTIIAALALIATGPSYAVAAGCNQETAQPVAYVELPGNPFAPVPTREGCWIFVSLTTGDSGSGPGVAVLKRLDGKISLARVVPVKGNPTGIVLTHDGELLIVAAGSNVAFIDVKRAISGAGNAVLGYWSDDIENAGRIYVNVTADDRYLFVSNERAGSISVVNLAKARASGFAADAAVGKIPVGLAPIALTFSSDERYLFTTSQSMPASGWPIECKPEQNPQAPPNHAPGAILVIDVKRAKIDPAHSVVSTVKAGCNPVRLAVSPKGDVAYVTARGDHALLMFSTEKLLSDDVSALLSKIPVGTAPVGIAVIDDGKKVVVTSSNRFAGGTEDKQSLYVIDASKAAQGVASLLGTIPAGGFPREIRVTSDQRTLLLTNFNSHTLEVVDLARLPLQPLPR